MFCRLKKNNFSHLLVISIVDINTGVISLNHSISSV